MDFSIGQALWQKIVEVLPLSPFQQFLAQFQGIPYLGYLNWFFPVSECLTVFLAWLGAVATFYLFSIIGRWIRAIS